MTIWNVLSTCRFDSEPQVCSSGLIAVNWPRVPRGSAAPIAECANGKTRLSGRSLTFSIWGVVS